MSEDVWSVKPDPLPVGYDDRTEVDVDDLRHGLPVRRYNAPGNKRDRPVSDEPENAPEKRWTVVVYKRPWVDTHTDDRK